MLEISGVDAPETGRVCEGQHRAERVYCSGVLAATEGVRQRFRGWAHLVGAGLLDAVHGAAAAENGAFVGALEPQIRGAGGHGEVERDARRKVALERALQWVVL